MQGLTFKGAHTVNDLFYTMHLVHYFCDTQCCASGYFSMLQMSGEWARCCLVSAGCSKNIPDFPQNMGDRFNSEEQWQ